MRTANFLHRVACAELIQLALFLMPEAAWAGSATWNVTPITSDWNTAANWTPSTVPNGASDVATFGFSNLTSISLSADTSVSEIGYATGAPSYSIGPGASFTLTLTGPGITNNSSAIQTFITGNSGQGSSEIRFLGEASAGSETAFGNEASSVSPMMPTRERRDSQ